MKDSYLGMILTKNTTITVPKFTFQLHIQGQVLFNFCTSLCKPTKYTSICKPVESAEYRQVSFTGHRQAQVTGHLLAVSSYRSLLAVRPSPFFRLLSNAFSDFGSIGRKRKKRNKKYWKRSLELGGPVFQRNIHGAWKQQDVVIKPTWRQWRKEKSMSWLNSSENSEKRMNHQNCMAKNCLCF